MKQHFHYIQELRWWWLDSRTVSGLNRLWRSALHELAFQSAAGICLRPFRPIIMQKIQIELTHKCSGDSRGVEEGCLFQFHGVKGGCFRAGANCGEGGRPPAMDRPVGMLILFWQGTPSFRWPPSSSFKGQRHNWCQNGGGKPQVFVVINTMSWPS